MLASYKIAMIDSTGVEFRWLLGIHPWQSMALYNLSSNRLIKQLLPQKKVTEEAKYFVANSIHPRISCDGEES